MAEATEGLQAIGSTAKRHWVWMLALAALAFVLVIRYRNTLATKLGTFLPAAVKSFLGISGVFFVVGGLLSLMQGDAMAATHCCAVPAGHGTLTAILSVLGGGGALATTMFSAPDVREAKLEAGSKVAAFSYSDPSVGTPAYDFYVDGTINTDAKGRPLVALDEVIEVATSIEVASGGAAITDDDMSLVVQTVKIDEPNILGTILDDTVGTGPILKHVVEFIGHAFNRCADAPVANVSGGATTAYTRYFTIPHAQRIQKDPMTSAIWLGILNKARVSVKLAPTAFMGSANAAASLTGASSLKVTTPFVAYDKWHWPVLSQYILEQPLGGTETVTLKLFGQKNAQGTDPTDYLFLVSVLSNLARLPGNQTLDNILQIDSEKLGIARLENVPALFKARLEAQVSGRSSAAYDNGNFVADVVPTGMNIASAKFLNLRQPGLDMVMSNMRPVTAGFELPISFKFSSIPANRWAFVLGSLRLLSPQVASQLQKLSGGKLGATPMAVKPYAG